MSRRLCLTVSSLLLGAPLTLVHAQELTVLRGSVHAVKFVCGRRPPAVSGLAGFDAVAPGYYYTAVNIRNATGDTVRIASQIATTRPGTAVGTLIPGPAVRLGPRLAVEVDCAEILAAAERSKFPIRGFLKGFLVLGPSARIDVVAVYTAGARQEVTTMAIERVPIEPASIP